ncbi:MAG: methyltransferase domain-containing protein [Candidatus Babeliaceae bacterium]|jgi:SAM-dependent methyltransferase
MIKKIVIIIIGAASICSAEEQYQDILVNNVVVSQGARECASRYEALKPLFKKYKRPFTVLDIGASQGYFTLRTAWDFPQAVGIMIEGNYSSDWHTSQNLLKICKKNTELSNIIFLNTHLTVEALERLADCEHFDVVLAFNIIHHFGKEWERAAQAIFRLGDFTIVESPPSHDKVFAQNHEVKALEEFLEDKNGVVIAKTPRHTDPSALALMRLYTTPKKEINYKHWFYGDSSAVGKIHYNIESTFEEKKFIKKNAEHRIERPWVPGINFITFKTLNGLWPDKEAVVSELLTFKNLEHGDLLPWNVIIRGRRLTAIDDDEGYFYNPSKCLLQTIGFSLLSAFEDVKNYILYELYPQVGAIIQSSSQVRSILTPVSYGELIDKITILEIKKSKTTDVKKLKNIETELAALLKVLNEHIQITPEVQVVINELRSVNYILWDVEDQLREREKMQLFDDEFVQLARKVYFTNDYRAVLKRKLNDVLGSDIIEEKIYAEYVKLILDEFKNPASCLNASSCKNTICSVLGCVLQEQSTHDV